MSGENEITSDADPARSGLDAKEAASAGPSDSTRDPATSSVAEESSTETAVRSQPADPEPAASAPQPTSDSEPASPPKKKPYPAEVSSESPATVTAPQTVDTNKAKAESDKQEEAPVVETSKPDPPASPTEKKSTDTTSTDDSKPVAIVASSKKSRPPYKYDPDKITLRFLFANRDGLTVTVECKPGDTVGEVKGALLSVWPDDLPDCDGGELLRLVCMGRGFLMPDSRTLEDCQIPVFKTHPTPVNVSVKPSLKGAGADSTAKSGGLSGGDGTPNSIAGNGAQQTSQGCACTIL